MKIETQVTPPDQDDNGADDIRSTRVVVSILDADDAAHEAAVQLFHDGRPDPERIALALERTVLAAARLAGPDIGWALARRLTAYDGAPST